MIHDRFFFFGDRPIHIILSQKFTTEGCQVQPSSSPSGHWGASMGQLEVKCLAQGHSTVDARGGRARLIFLAGRDLPVRFCSLHYNAPAKRLHLVKRSRPADLYGRVKVLPQRCFDSVMIRIVCHENFTLEWIWSPKTLLLTARAFELFGLKSAACNFSP